MRIAIRGFGYVAWGAASKSRELVAKVVTISGPDGYVYDPDGISGEKIDYMLELRASGEDIVAPYAEKYGVQFFPGKRPWEQKVDIALPCATQNELDLEDAKQLVANGVKAVCEGANMPTTLEATEYFQNNGVLFICGKASNAGGVATSALEMSQNSERMSWTFEEVDAKLEQIMINIYHNIDDAAKRYGMEGNYVAGANIAGFEKVVNAMLAQGVY